MLGGAPPKNSSASATMKPRFLTLALFTAAFASVVSAAEKLPAIFNGKDLTGWQDPVSNKFWRVEDGILVGESDAALKGNYLLTEKSYGDFVIEFDVRFKSGPLPRGLDTGLDMRKPR